MFLKVSSVPVIIYAQADDENLAAQFIQSGVQDVLIRGQINGKSLARSVRSAIDRKHTAHALELRNREIQILYEAGQALSQTLDLDRLYETFMHILKKVMHCDHLFISSFEKEAGMIYCVFGMEGATILDVASFPPVYLEPEGQGTQSRVLRSGKSLLSNDWQTMFVSNDNRYYIEDDGTAFTVDQLPEDAEITRSGIIVPLIFQEQVIGAIQILSIHKNTYTENDLRIAEALASQIAVASNNAILYRRAQFEIEERKRADENIKRQVERLMAISEFDRRIGINLNLDDHLPKLTELVCTYLHVDAALILLLDAPAQELVYSFGHGFTANTVTALRIPTGTDYVGRNRLEEARIASFDLSEAGVHLSQAKFWQTEGFTSFYSVPLAAKGVLKGVLEVFHRTPFDADFEWLDFLETLGGQLSLAINEYDLFNDLQRSNRELVQAYDATIEGWSHALDLRDKETEGHSRRVTDITVKIAQAYGYHDKDLAFIRYGALLHDIGKMGVPDHILLKPGALTPEEWVEMRKHPTYGYEFLLPNKYLEPALSIPHCHHEKWDGTGYPRGLKGEEIPLAARMFSVVDVWDALNSDRPYRKAWPIEKTLEHIRTQAGVSFDPQVVEVFIRLLTE